MLAVALSACGQAPSAPREATLKIEGFEQYVTGFEKSAAEHGRALRVQDLEIRFGQVDAADETGGRGVCEYSPGHTPVITLSREAWDSSSEAEREELVFHELGHCVLLKRHETGINSAGIPKSLMNPWKIEGSVYLQHKRFYLSSLFSR